MLQTPLRVLAVSLLEMKQEDYWISTLKTSAHFWLNGEYSV